MVTEHVAREPKAPAEAPPAALQQTIGGDPVPVGATETKKRKRGPLRTDEQRLADLAAETERIKGKGKAKVLDAVAAVKEAMAELPATAIRVGMPKLAAELDKVNAALKRTDGIAD